MTAATNKVNFNLFCFQSSFRFVIIIQEHSNKVSSNQGILMYHISIDTTKVCKYHEYELVLFQACLSTLALPKKSHSGFIPTKLASVSP